MEERDAPEQIVFGSMDSRMCPVLNLAVYIETAPHAATSTFLYGNPNDGDRVVRRALQQTFENSRFNKLKLGKMGTHSLRKGAATYGSRSGLSKDYVNRRGRWRTKKSMVDEYMDNTQPYPDARAEAVLTGPQGPCRYVPVRDLQCLSSGTLACDVAPTARKLWGDNVAATLGYALLWAAVEQTTRSDFELMPVKLKEKVTKIYVAAGGNIGVNPVSREPFYVVGDGSELQLMDVNDSESAVGAVNEAMAAPVSVGPSPTTANGGSEFARRQFAALHAQLFSLKRDDDCIRKESARSQPETQQEVKKLRAMVKRLAERPIVAVATTARGRAAEAPAGVPTRAPALLSKRPKDLFELWYEYEIGLHGQKAAKDFTPGERGRNKFAFSRRKVFWDAIAALVRAGTTSEEAIDRVYAAFGRHQSVSAILTGMRQHRKTGGHPNLRV